MKTDDEDEYKLNTTSLIRIGVQNKEKPSKNQKYECANWYHRQPDANGNERKFVNQTI